MAANVYTTAGGRRFHADLACRALESGRALSDADCGCYEFCNHRLPTTHLPRKHDSIDAARAGYTACRACVPTADALPATGQTYGHEPFGPYDGVLICRRCYVTVTREWVDAYDAPRHQRVRDTVPWPCMSAVVLGLAPRLGAAQPAPRIQQTAT
jgi:hypothetical protein